MILASLFNLGTQELFKLDLAKKTIRNTIMYLLLKDEIQEWCHEAALYPSQNAHILAAGSHYRKFDNSKIEIRVYDEHQTTLAGSHMASKSNKRRTTQRFPLY